MTEFKHGLCRFCVSGSICGKAGEEIYSCPDFVERIE
ncbi:hypothetical protein ES703_00003 [subsurface metagenome]